jgi:hypothetical protein
LQCKSCVLSSLLCPWPTLTQLLSN